MVVLVGVMHFFELMFDYRLQLSIVFVHFEVLEATKHITKTKQNYEHSSAKFPIEKRI